uniref:Uncharacterized protein n=1 Tax=Siphoviridae sp. ctKgQ2 TaxID=2827842 RepID=A0A8S5TM24_9CAUD|nr:MAG TPA: hypothetical protein [Siphoviridae sp. ctKgQ2]DAJ00661.1 MAG TPA: hypothetical protein [Caudoviricetes sp.]
MAHVCASILCLLTASGIPTSQPIHRHPIR